MQRLKDQGTSDQTDRDSRAAVLSRISATASALEAAQPGGEREPAP
jgi:hypothetical protein